MIEDSEKRSSLNEFKEDLSAAFKALAEDSEIKVSFPLTLSTGTPQASYNEYAKSVAISLPDEVDADMISHVRGEADSLALFIKHHKENKNLSENEGINSFIKRMERMRVESIGSLEMEGVRQNILKKWEKNISKENWDNKDFLKEVPLSEITALMGYKEIVKEDLPENSDLIMKTLAKMLERKIGGYLKKLPEFLDNQEEFAKISQKIATSVLAEIGASEEEDENSEETKNVSSGKDDNAGTDDMNASSVPEKDNDAKGETPSGVKTSLGDEKHEDKSDISKTGNKVKRNKPVFDDNVSYIYSVYTRKFDKILKAGEIADEYELKELRTQLDDKISEIKDITARLAARLQRKLMSTQLRSWDFNMEEGVLDPAKLSAVIIDPTYPYPFKWERDAIYKNTVVSLLIDNSGSMRGRHITMAAIVADILAHTLERCSVKVEVLGFTTANWKGGEARKLWEKEGSPNNSGRLNDLLHIVYKDADTPWRIAKPGLGLMLKEGLLKENIDGEAILWANDRLLNRPEERKILMVISDGAPVDDSTLSSNSPEYLDFHLRQVIKNIESQKMVELLAVGIGHKVTDYYKRSVMISSVNQLGDAMIGELSKLFEEPKYKAPRLRPKTL